MALASHGVSRTLHKNALRAFKLGASSMMSAFEEDLIEIYPFPAKTLHVKRLHDKTGIAFRDMLFFDNLLLNCQAVRILGVTCVHTPEGLNTRNWNKGLAAFPNYGRKIIDG